MARNLLTLCVLALIGFGCAIASIRPAAPHPLPAPRLADAALPLTVTVETVMGGGTRPCEHLAGAMVERLREQHLIAQWREAWTTPASSAPAPLRLRLTFDCSLDDHPTLTLYTYMLVGGTFFLASPLPLFDLDYTVRATADVFEDDRLLRRYESFAHADGDYNYWAALRPDVTAPVIQRGEEDLVARLVDAIVTDRPFWEGLARQSWPRE